MMKIYHQRNKIPADWQLVETHSHTLPVSQCSELEYKDLLDIYADNGYSGILRNRNIDGIELYNGSEESVNYFV